VLGAVAGEAGLGGGVAVMRVKGDRTGLAREVVAFQ
jgi:hypothetical protein